jgi:hypothetical protein
MWTKSGINNQMAVFDCVIEDRVEVVRAQLNVFSPADTASFLESQTS